MGLKGSKTEQSLRDAFAGESQANRRYLYFANKADIEGQNDVAARTGGRVDALALAEAVPELLHFLRRHVVGAPVTRGPAHGGIVAPLR